MASARRPAFSASARSPNNSRRQPRRALDLGLVLAGDLFKIVHRGDDLGGDAVLLEVMRSSTFKSSTVAEAPLESGRSRSMRGSVLGSRSSPAFTASRICSPARERSNPLGMERSCASRSGVVGCCVAISPITSSFKMRERGMSRPCASRSRHAATSISTPSSFGLRARERSRSQACSGSCAIGVGRGQHRHLLAHPFAAAPLGEVGVELHEARRADG